MASAGNEHEEDGPPTKRMPPVLSSALQRATADTTTTTASSPPTAPAAAEVKAQKQTEDKAAPITHRSAHNDVKVSDATTTKPRIVAPVVIRDPRMKSGAIKRVRRDLKVDRHETKKETKKDVLDAFAALDALEAIDLPKAIKTIEAIEAIEAREEEDDDDEPKTEDTKAKPEADDNNDDDDDDDDEDLPATISPKALIDGDDTVPLVALSHDIVERMALEQPTASGVQRMRAERSLSFARAGSPAAARPRATSQLARIEQKQTQFLVAAIWFLAMAIAALLAFVASSSFSS